MPLARVIMRGFFLKERFGVNGIQKASRSLGISAGGAREPGGLRAAADDGMGASRAGRMDPDGPGRVPAA